MGAFVGVVWFIGLVVAVSVIRSRAGLGIWQGLRGSDAWSYFWLTKIGIYSIFWPVTLAVWLVRGRPEPPVVFERTPSGFRRRIQQPGER